MTSDIDELNKMIDSDEFKQFPALQRLAVEDLRNSLIEEEFPPDQRSDQYKTWGSCHWARMCIEEYHMDNPTLYKIYYARRVE